MAERVAAFDWSATSLGPADSWPLELRAMTDVVLASRFPMVFWWGPDHVQLYNDAYLPIIGGKHPAALGQNARDCWSEIWDVIGPQIDGVYRGGPATYNENVLLDINRHGFVGESYFTWSYSPLPSASSPAGVGGVFCTVQETTENVIGERRILLLRDLAAHGTEARSAEDECRVAASTLARYARSVPFSLIYLIDETKGVARLAACSGIDLRDPSSAPPTVDLTRPSGPWPLYEALQAEAPLRVADLASVLTNVPAGTWPEPPREAIVVPIQSGIANDPAGVLVAGVNPRERLDDAYRTFYTLLAGQIASAISSARAYESERRRAEALAELDRAKIEFFSNVSHEFRTPLTLMLGPLADLLRNADPSDAPLIEVAHRNALRLLKLVNTLLEFARLEAGRTEASFVETDLATMTLDLAALFRSAVESAGLRFVTDVELHDRAFVDRSMWEMIVLNLLSNALKFTHAGEIRLALRAVAGDVELTVADTGIGIPPADLPFIFERFRRVRGARSRSHEGSGIGLALVDELAHLHGGSIAVESEPERGSVFTVRIPLGRDHLDPASVATAPSLPHASVVEQYLADVDSTIVRGDMHAAAVPGDAKAARILLADDNADLRAYVTRILAPQHDVVTVRNGVEALAVLRSQRIDVVVSDVMMPEMDGFELVAAIRNDPALATIPFIMLSARAGESSAVEGLTRGADDYLVKPFAADELLARVRAQLQAASLRERATSRAEDERAFLAEASRILAESLDLASTFCNLAHLTLPRFGDWCQIDVVTPSGGIRTVAVAHRDAELNELAQRLVGRIHLNPDARAGSPYTIRTGRTEVLGDARGIANDVVGDDLELDVYRRMGIGAAACVPLVADGAILGSITFCFGDPTRRYAPTDVHLLEEIGRRSGVAVKRATAFEREHRVAQSFQNASLPLALPTVHGTTFDAVYVPANDEAQVGGDWYDAVRLADGRVVVSIGDVAGNGLRAAVTMGNMRQIIRGIAQVHADPALMLDAADRALRLEHPDQFVTAFVGVFDPVAATFAYASAGHPPPMLRRPDGSVELLSDGGLPLGLRHVSKEQGRSIALDAGSTLVFYTDGLTEVSRRPADGEERVRDLLRDGALLATEHPARALRDAVFVDRPATDDVAILVMGIGELGGNVSGPAQPIERWIFDASDGGAAHAARRAFTEGLRRHAAGPDCIAQAEVVFGELVGNVVRYAPGIVEVTVDWSGADPVLHVLDHGPGFQHVPALPRDVYSESGRGLYLISSLSEDFSVAKRPQGGSHARAVLALDHRPFRRSR